MRKGDVNAMSKNPLLDAERAVSVAEQAVRRAELYFDWEGSGPRHTRLQKLREIMGDAQAELACISAIKPEGLSEEHNVEGS